MRFGEAPKRFRIDRISRAGDDVRIAARVEGLWFSAAVSILASADELKAAAMALADLESSGAGHYHWQLTEGSLDLMFAMAKKGELHVTVRMRSAPDYLDEVSALFELAQADLPRLRSEIFALAE